MQNYKRLGLLLVLFLAAIAPVIAQSPNLQQAQLDLNLNAQVNRTHLLSPKATIVTDTINIDDTDRVNIGFYSRSKTLKIELISPSGQHFYSSNSNKDGVRIRIYADPAPNTKRAKYLFVLTRPQAGKWSYIITETVPLTRSSGVLMDMFSNSPVRAGMQSDFNNRANGDVYLSLVVAEGRNILKNLFIKATVAKVNEFNSPATTINFHDDGINGDATAGDGLFTASFKSQISGEFQAFADITGTTSKGQNFQRHAYTTFNINPDVAHFVGSFTNRGIDTDGDGLFNQIGVSPTVQVLEAGKYGVQITLTASNGESITAYKPFDLLTGNATPEVTFDSEDVKNFLKVNGAYVVSTLIFSYNDLAIAIDRADNLGSTEPYQIKQLQRKPIEASGRGSAVGIDTNNNGKFDYLDVSIATNFLYSGYYNWSANLVDKNERFIALASGGGFLGAGDTKVKLRFNGAAIGNSRAIRPYYVKNLIVYGGGRSLRVNKALTIKHLTASQFVGFEPDDKEPPKLTVSVTPNILYPPDRQMVEVKVNTTVSDNIDPNPSIGLVSISNNESQGRLRGDRNTSTDIEVKSDGRIFLRAERLGTGVGRVYTLTYGSRDAAGNVSQQTVEVKVPLQQSN